MKVQPKNYNISIAFELQDSPEAANEKPLRITGTPENVEAAKQLVIDIVNQGDVSNDLIRSSNSEKELKVF